MASLRGKTRWPWRRLPRRVPSGEHVVSPQLIGGERRNPYMRDDRRAIVSLLLVVQAGLALLAATNLVDDTRAGIVRFTDVPVALADGYRPTTPPRASTVHYVNPAYKQVGMDPTRPQALVYANTPSGPTLLGAMYMLPKANLAAPDIGGSLAPWHTHTNLCFLLPSFAIDGIESPFGTCPVGAIH